MISYVVAYSKNRVIGNRNQLPWHLPNDLKHFKEITLGKTVVMGRKTYESIGKPLPQRTNVVLTRDQTFQADGVEIAHHKAEVLSRKDDLYVIGGEQIFKMFLDVVEQIYLTEIEVNMEGDTFFPEWNPAVFELAEKKAGVCDERNTLPHTFYTYKRIKK